MPLPAWQENEITPPALAVVWDGAGWGLEGEIWGGEFFEVTAENIKRVASMPSFRLPGAEKAIREPRRAALGLLYAIYGRLFI